MAPYKGTHFDPDYQAKRKLHFGYPETQHGFQTSERPHDARRASHDSSGHRNTGFPTYSHRSLSPSKSKGDGTQRSRYEPYRRSGRHTRSRSLEKQCGSASSNREDGDTGDRGRGSNPRGTVDASRDDICIQSQATIATPPRPIHLFNSSLNDMTTTQPPSSPFSTSGLGSLDKLRKFKEQVEASRHSTAANSTQEVNTLSVAEIAEMFLSRQNGNTESSTSTSCSDNKAMRMANSMAVEAAAASSRMSDEKGTMSSPELAEVREVRVNGLTNGGDGDRDRDREAELKDKLRVRHIMKGQLNSGAPHAGGSHGGSLQMRIRPSLLDAGHYLAPEPLEQPREDRQNAEGLGASDVEVPPVVIKKNFITRYAQPRHATDRRGPSPRDLRGSNYRSISPTRRRISVPDRPESEPRRRTSQSHGSALRMSPTKLFVPLWERRSGSVNDHHDADRGGDLQNAHMGKRSRENPDRPRWNDEPMKPRRSSFGNEKRTSGSHQHQSASLNSPRDRMLVAAPQSQPNGQPRTSEGDILATLEGLKAQIARLEAQLPAQIKGIQPYPNQSNITRISTIGAINGYDDNRRNSNGYREPHNGALHRREEPSAWRIANVSRSGAAYGPLSLKMPNGLRADFRSREEDRSEFKNGPSHDAHRGKDRMDSQNGYTVKKQNGEYKYEVVATHSGRDREYAGPDGGRGRVRSSGSGSVRARGRGRGIARARGGRCRVYRS